jgi:putative glycosyltransferase involved in LPS biosynthesis
MKNIVFLISLSKDENRREVLKKRFNSFQNFRLIDAIDGREMKAKEYFSIANPSLKVYKKLLSPAEVGCSLSHVKAYKEFLQSDADFGLILEDDVIGSDDDIEFAFEMALKITKDSILICGCQDGLAGRFSAFGKKILSQNSKDGKDVSFYDVSTHSFGSISRAAAYIVTKKSAQSLLCTHQTALCTTDVWDILLKQNGLKMYFCDIFSHPLDLSCSNIEMERNERGYKPGIKAYIKSIKFLFFSRFERIFMRFERIFKANK